MDLSRTLTEDELLDLSNKTVSFTEHAMTILGLVLCSGGPIVTDPHVLATMLTDYKLEVTEDTVTGRKTYRAVEQR